MCDLQHLIKYLFWFAGTKFTLSWNSIGLSPFSHYLTIYKTPQEKFRSHNDVLQFPPDMSIFTQKAKFVFFGMFQLDLQYCTTKTQPEPQLPLTPPLTQTYPPLTLAIWFGVTYYALSLSLFHLL